MCVTGCRVPLRNLPGGIGSKQVGTMRKGVGIFVKWSIPVNGRTWVCCTHSSRMTQRSSSSSIQKGNDEQPVYEREDEQVIRQPGNDDFPSVDAISVEPVSIAFNGIKTADESKPFAQLRKVMG